jgi:hypothetical protein
MLSFICLRETVPLTPIFLFFTKLEPNTRSLAKNQKNRILLRVSSIRSKRGSFERLIRGLKKKKVRQKCQFLKFFNETFTVYVFFGGE